ncbi:MAG TPA: diguanylate cyclase [Usitatibacteraceae bacterium]
MSFVRTTPEGSLQLLIASWQRYRERGTFEQFAEFALALNSLTELFAGLRLPGLVRLCEGLENAVLPLFGDASAHPIAEPDAVVLTRQLEALLQAMEHAQPRAQAEAREKDAGRDAGRLDAEPADDSALREWTKPREVWLVAGAEHPWVAALVEQFTVFGFRIARMDWGAATPEASPLVMLLIPPPTGYGKDEIDWIARMRPAHPASQLFCLNVPRQLVTMVNLLRAGADVTIQPEEQTTTSLARVLDLIQAREQEPFRVLLVEDSATAVAVIQRALAQHGIDNQSITDPQQLLSAVEAYRPDLVLMDMHMPHCNGVEATRVLRQVAAYQSVPVVYLSSEKDMGMQVEALRLGGDQFLTKPCNPVLLGAVVNTKIERYREMQRSSLHDGLTGLLNHSASKTRLGQLLQTLRPERDRLCVAMLDIDHFKSVNDTYGHPVGDQVIRSLAWLLKGRLRATDIIGRYGGEEFLVVLRGADADEAHAVLDRIRRDFANMPHVHGAGVLRATFSAGLCAYPARLTVSDLSKAADDALLAAKRAGRNRIERAPA